VRPEGLCKIKNSNDTIGIRTRELPACSAVVATDIVINLRHFALDHLKSLSVVFLGCVEDSK
jgi:hypothetical protein